MKKTEKRKVAEVLRAYRAINRLSQGEFGKLCDLTQMTVSLIENEKFERVSLDTIKKVEEYVAHH